MTDTDAKGKDTSEDDGKNTDAKAKGKDTDSSNQDAPKFTQADLDRIAAKTREEEKVKAKAAKEKDDRERAEKDDEQQKKFEKLSADRKTRIDEIEPQLERLTTIVAELAVAGLKDLPDEVKEASPAQFGEDKSLTNPLEVLAWLPKGKALAERLEGQPARGGATVTDPKQKGQAPQAVFESSRERLLQSGKYGM